MWGDYFIAIAVLFTVVFPLAIFYYKKRRRNIKDFFYLIIFGIVGAALSWALAYYTQMYGLIALVIYGLIITPFIQGRDKKTKGNSK
jgi:uncharacterized membrane protein YfcA